MSVVTDKKKIEKVLSRGVEQVYPSKKEVQKRMESGNRLRIYLGIDPTASKLHIGHALQLRKLTQFQELGHEVIFLIGSFTAMIGDPTDKSAARTQLSQKDVLKNAATFKKQAAKIISFKGRNAAKIMFNNKWLAKMSFANVVDLASRFTVQQMSERDMFANRIKEGKPVYLHEFMYPLMQAYDSVAMDVDMEIGGSDQTFNMLAGRTLMKSMKKKDKMVITTKLLTNDEGKKMSKTEGGFIALNDAPEDMYGKLMSMDDGMIIPYFELATDLSMEEVEGIKLQLDSGSNPRDIKAKLAETIVAMFHGDESAVQAGEHFNKVFRDHSAPEDIDEFKVSEEKNIIDVLVESGLASSRTEARRFVNQKAIKIDGTPVSSLETELKGTKEGIVLQRGKRHFVKLVK